MVIRHDFERNGKLEKAKLRSRATRVSLAEIATEYIERIGTRQLAIHAHPFQSSHSAIKIIAMHLLLDSRLAFVRPLIAAQIARSVPVDRLSCLESDQKKKPMAGIFECGNLV